MYLPAFFEIFLGLVAIVLWSLWLERRTGPPVLFLALRWVAGCAVMLGLVVAFGAIVTQAGGITDPTPVLYARWGSFGVVVACLVVELGLTVRHLAQRTRNHHQASP